MISCQNLNVCADVKGYAKTYFDQMSSLLGAAEKSILVKTLVILVVKKPSPQHLSQRISRCLQEGSVTNKSTK